MNTEPVAAPLILITGVSTGIGRAAAEKFAAEGWRVIGTMRDPARFDAGDGWPADVRLEALDLAEPGSAAALAARVLAEVGAPDALLNNAGTVQFGPIECATDEEFHRIFQVNFFGQMELIRALLPAMRERGSGVIANVTSLGGRLTFPFFGIYNSSKWALEGLSEGLWHELKPFGIKVKAIEPGFVETAIWNKALRGPGGEEFAGPEPYAPYMERMRDFEQSISKRTPSADAAQEVFDAVTDTSDRLRYPVAAYADALVGARRVFGDQAEMAFFHKRWMGEDAG